MIPIFWQLFWDEQIKSSCCLLWEQHNLKKMKNKQERFYWEQNGISLLPIEKFQQNVLQNRSFEENVSDPPYDAWYSCKRKRCRPTDVLDVASLWTKRLFLINC